MLEECERKHNADFSYGKFVIAFFFRRAIEMFESFLLLISRKRLIDGLILLRSFCEMGINLGYIFSDENNENEKNIRALKYVLAGDRAQLKLIITNLEDFREFDDNIEHRRNEVASNIEKIENILCDEYGIENWELISIEERAKHSGFDVVKSIYNQIYRYTSNIEHHNMFFGQDYVSTDNCIPLKTINEFHKLPHIKSPVSLYLFRIIYIEILVAFNNEYHLNFDDNLSKLRKKHEKEYSLLKNSE